MNLSGVESWDDLYIKIDTTANTSEFFFNGNSYGAISHGATPANLIGSVRIERLDRSSAANDDVHFDTLSIGAVDPNPPRLNFSRAGAALSLSWPAIRMGATLQTTADLSASTTWNSISNGIIFASGSNIFVTPMTNTTRFFRLQSR